MKEWPFNSNPATSDALKRRVLIFGICFSLILLGLFIRLWNLQVIQGEKFRTLSEDNRIAYRLVQSPRGMVFDSKGELLADNRASFNIYLIRENVKKLRQTIRLLSEITEQPFQELYKRTRLANPFRPFLIKADISRKTMAFLEEHKPDYPGVFVQVTPLRQYPSREKASHLLGYMGEVSNRQLQRLKKRNYRQGDLLGQYGVEQTQERFLRGQSGFKQVEVDAYGRELRIVRPFVEKAGNNVYLTIDMELQKKAEELFEAHEGSIVILDPSNGAILAMVSKPSFNPNIFAGGIDAKDWKGLMQDPLKPLENRAIRGQYPPGSIFKIVMGFAILNEKIARSDEKVLCHGSFPFGKRIFQDWKKGGHGPIDFVQSLAQSCDVYYYTNGQKLGIKRIAHYARMFGLGSPTGFGAVEKGGLVPSDAWKRRRFKERWYEGETISVSIGQGFNLITPMQAANLIATVANGGNLWKPYVVEKVLSPDGKPLFESRPRLIRKIPISQKIFRKVREGLKEAVHGKKGTAKKAQVPDIFVAGKTGTAQTVDLKYTGRKRKPEELPRKFRDHSWFVAFAPYENPTIAIAILGENAGRPGSFFAPYAKELISFYLTKNEQQILASNKTTEEKRLVPRNRVPRARR
ncbi:MAG: penicillin-binding protein 2 [Nitrospinae bacterium]|nr:penicillin-binding protein 2 [Nitrospinota bacterium]